MVRRIGGVRRGGIGPDRKVTSRRLTVRVAGGGQRSGVRLRECQCSFVPPQASTARYYFLWE